MPSPLLDGCFRSAHAPPGGSAISVDPVHPPLGEHARVATPVRKRWPVCRRCGGRVPDVLPAEEEDSNPRYPLACQGGEGAGGRSGWSRNTPSLFTGDQQFESPSLRQRTLSLEAKLKTAS